MPVEVKRWMARDGCLHATREAAVLHEEGEMIKEQLFTMLFHDHFLGNIDPPLVKPYINTATPSYASSTRITHKD